MFSISAGKNFFKYSPGHFLVFEYDLFGFLNQEYNYRVSILLFLVSSITKIDYISQFVNFLAESYSNQDEGGEVPLFEIYPVHSFCTAHCKCLCSQYYNIVKRLHNSTFLQTYINHKWTNNIFEERKTKETRTYFNLK